MPVVPTRYDPGLDYYERLGVSPHATAGELLEAHRAAARRHHPDIGGDPNGITIRRVNEAYSVLRDRAKRAEYDRARRTYLLTLAAPERRPAVRRRARPRSPARRFLRAAGLVLAAAIGLLLLLIAVAGARHELFGPAASRSDRAVLRQRGAREVPGAEAVSYDYATPLDPGRPGAD
ncbi:MAG: DnaJ domain-containing protein [Planctomycetota bacterium]